MKLKFLHVLRNQRKPRAKGKCEKKPRKPLFVKKGSHKYPRSLEERLVDLIGRCVHVTYYDHLLLRNVPINSLKKLKKLPTRETVGWLDDVGFEGDLSYVMIRWDRRDRKSVV